MLGATAGSAYVRLGVEMAGFRRDMTHAERQFTSSTGRMSSQATRTGFSIRRGLGLVSGVAGALGGIYLLERAFHAAWREMEQGERVTAQTRAAIASTGGVANVTADDVMNLAKQWQALAGVDDEITQHGANILLTFRSIKNEVGDGNDIFNQSVAALLDMGFALQEVGSMGESAAGGVDSLQATAIRLGKALNDPVKGVTALRRVGVQFTRDEEKMIKRMAETGHVLEAQKMILKELTAEFGGSAEAAGTTMPQALDRLKNTATDAAAVYLTALIPAMEDAVTWIQNQVDAFAGNTEAQEKFRKEVEDIVTTVHDLASEANDVADALGGWENVIKILIALKFLAIIGSWAGAMRGYSRATWGAVAATTALGGAQAGAGAAGLRGLLAAGGKVLGGTALAGIGVTGLVAAGSVAAILATPGASGGSEGNRRSRMKALFDGEYADEYPNLTNALYRLANGYSVSPKELAAIHTLGQATEADMKRVENQLRRINRVAAGGVSAGAAKKGRGASLGTGKRAPPIYVPPTVELSTETQLAIAHAATTPESDVDDLKAANAALREINVLLKQSTLTDEERITLLNAKAGLQGQINSILDSRTSEAKSAHDEAVRQAKERKDAAATERQNAHDERVFQLERKVAIAEETEGYADDLKRLNALRVYQRRWRDAQKKGTQDYRDAQDELDNTNARIREKRQARRQHALDARRGRLEEKLARAEENEGVADDIKALRQLRAYWIARRNEHKRYSDAYIEAQAAIDDANRKMRVAKKKASEGKGEAVAGSIAAAMSHLETVISEFAPNFLSDDPLGELLGPKQTMKSRRPGVVINQTFPNIPLDYHKEARYAVAAAKAAFDG